MTLAVERDVKQQINLNLDHMPMLNQHLQNLLIMRSIANIKPMLGQHWQNLPTMQPTMATW